MSLSNKVDQFFKEVEAVWAVIPSWIKVFFYSTTSSVVGLWVANALDPKSVALIVLTNLGIYQAPRTVRKLL